MFDREPERMRYQQTDAGFTLIEVLIVVAIVGILVVIAIPQFQSYRARALNSSAVADLKCLKTGVEAFKADTDEYPTGVLFQ